MQKLLSSYEHITCYVDGSSVKNPGLSGSGACFFGSNRVEAKRDDEISTSPKDHGDIFLFGISLHLGLCSNNYAEYVGLIIGQLFLALFESNTVTFLADSQLVV